MPPALRISCFISNGSAQPGKLIKGCSQVCTARAATAQGGCCCFLQVGRRGFVLFPSMSGAAMLLCIHQGDGGSRIASPMMARPVLCIVPQRESRCCRGTLQVWTLGCTAKPRKAHKTFQLSTWITVDNCNVDAISPVSGQEAKI